MGQLRIGHGCIVAVTAVLVPWAPLQPAVSGQPIPVGSLVFDIDYDVAEDALPLTSVTLWYRLDGDSMWQVFGLDEDCQSPVTFRAHKEGRYAFYIVATNATGASGAPPVAETPPHVEAFVDATPPVVQLHALRTTVMLGGPVVQIRWTAVDAHLGARPIALAYQRPPDPAWYPMTPDPVANTGRYDWRVPDALTGAVAVRLTVTDHGAHQVHSDTQTIEVAATALPPPAGALAADRAAAPRFEASALAGSARAKVQAKRLFAEAAAHQARGEYREGIARLRQAIKLDPDWAEAFAAMADMLYAVGDLDRALHAYDLALQQEPTMRDALRGAAAIHRRRNNHALAADALRTILRYNPNDAEVWMNLGDVAVYQGDEVLARECYTRASQIDPDATQVVADARKRLELMTEVSRQYRASGR